MGLTRESSGNGAATPAEQGTRGEGHGGGAAGAGADDDDDAAAEQRIRPNP